MAGDESACGRFWVTAEAVPVFTEAFLMQKVNYVHQNPVRAGLVPQAEDYGWWSVRYWQGKPGEAEPLRVDADKIVWGKPR